MKTSTVSTFLKEMEDGDVQREDGGFMGSRRKRRPGTSARMGNRKGKVRLQEERLS